MKIKHSGLDLAGIIIIYIVAGFFAFSFLFDSLNYYNAGNSSYGSASLILSILFFFALIMTILYHSNKITNYIAIGILGILVSLLGGIFIIIGRLGHPEPRTIIFQKASTHNFNIMKKQLRQLDNLRAKGIITQEEYNKKRQSIIDEM